jgi:hypothetical protein
MRHFRINENMEIQKMKMMLLWFAGVPIVGIVLLKVFGFI